MGVKVKVKKLTLKYNTSYDVKGDDDIVNENLNALSRNWSLNSGIAKIHVSNRNVILTETVGS